MHTRGPTYRRKSPSTCFIRTGVLGNILVLAMLKQFSKSFLHPISLSCSSPIELKRYFICPSIVVQYATWPFQFHFLYFIKPTPFLLFLNFDLMVSILKISFSFLFRIESSIEFRLVLYFPYFLT